MSKRREISIIGMRCRSCEKMIHDTLLEIDGITSAKVSLKHSSAVIESENYVNVADIEQAVQRAGYKVGKENRPPLISRNSRDWFTALCGVAIVSVLFWIFNTSGISLDVDASKSNGGNDAVYALVMGLTAGFSTCMALIGGLVAGLAARHRQQRPNITRLQSFRPHVFFNLGRIAGFALLGGLLGLVGSAFVFSPFVMGVLTLIAGIFTLIIGLQLTGVFPRLSAWSLPPKLSEKLGIGGHKTKAYNPWRSVMLGALTFLLPCGFTQAMQLYSVSTGSWAAGALTMGLFALGTTPGLLLIGGATAFMRGRKGKTALKFSGVLVSVLALMSASAGLNLTGFRLPEFNFQSNEADLDVPEENHITLVFRDPYRMFEQEQIILEKGENYRITINPEKDGYGCMATILLPGLTDTKAQLIKAGKPIVYTFTAKSAGEYQFICAMGIPFNVIIKVEE
ncbi:MAG: sulfite exporter TauE/SafE family protein [Clostridiales bacterium]|jgi:sulfite exporter TauE/SafE/copper chaperone CopZ|nr:sulfite exporter TauE/SafE family protein [Clostridiales bacterium]